MYRFLKLTCVNCTRLGIFKVKYSCFCSFHIFTRENEFAFHFSLTSMLLWCMISSLVAIDIEKVDIKTVSQGHSLRREGEALSLLLLHWAHLFSTPWWTKCLWFILFTVHKLLSISHPLKSRFASHALKKMITECWSASE